MIQLVRKAPAPLAGHGLILGVTFCLVNLPLAPIRMNDAYDSRAVEKFYWRRAWAAPACEWAAVFERPGGAHPSSRNMVATTADATATRT